MKASNPAHAFAVTFVDELARCGIGHAVLSPGSRSTPLALALAGDPRIDLQVCLDERSAAFLALGIAKATHTPTALLSTSGTAPANFHPAVLEADLGRVPLLVLTADRPPELRDTGATQTVDQIKLYGDRLRWFCEAGAPEALPISVAYWRSLVCRAVAEASRGPAGPVHINVPLREPLVPTDEVFPYPLDGRADGAAWTKHECGARALGGGRVEALAQELLVERGVVVAGSGPYDPRSVIDLAERLGWPLLADPLSGARSGNNAIAAYEALLRVDRFAEHHRPEIVLRLGALGTSKPLLNFLRDARRHVLLDPDGLTLDPARSTESIIGADVTGTIAALSEHITPVDPGGWLETWQRANDLALGIMTELLERDGILSEPRLARDLVAAVPDGSNLVIAASMPVRDVEAFSLPRSGLRFHMNRGANGIDGFVSTAVGVALGSAAPTYALCGDLSFLHDRNALLADAVRAVDLTLVVVNNDGGGIFSFLPQADDATHFERLFGTPHGIDLATVAASHGLDHRLLEKASDLEPALAARGPGVRILEVRTDRDANVALHRAVHQAVETALRD